MNLTMVNERLDRIQSEILRLKNGRLKQLSEEVEETRLRIAAFIGAPLASGPLAGAIVPLAELEKAAILHAVFTCRDKHCAAEMLGIGKTTLYRKLEQYGKGGPA